MNTKPFVIYNPSEYSQSEDGAGFWSNEDGWVPLEYATRYEDAPDGMLPLGGQSLEIGSMKDYRLQVFETPGDKEPITFICFAEDRAHAVEQALDSYPDGRVLSYNTKLTLLYRDANNYKQSQEVILQGAITAEQVKAIIKRTADLGEFGAVIADQINLPTPAEKMMDIQGSLGWPNPESDHVYTDIIEITQRGTKNQPIDYKQLAESLWVELGKEDDDAYDTGMSVDDLVGLLNKIQFWDIEHEVSRQETIGNYEAEEEEDSDGVEVTTDMACPVYFDPDNMDDTRILVMMTSEWDDGVYTVETKATLDLRTGEYESLEQVDLEDELGEDDERPDACTAEYLTIGDIEIDIQDGEGCLSEDELRTLNKQVPSIVSRVKTDQGLKPE